MTAPTRPKIYHILHVDRLSAVVRDSRIWSDALIRGSGRPGTDIGMSAVKDRRLHRELGDFCGMRVGACAPFYFCPRSVMLYVIHRGDHPQLAYKGGQSAILHLEADLVDTVDWARWAGYPWAITDRNAASPYARHWSDLKYLDRINWDAVYARHWFDVKEQKQAEFLIDIGLPWSFVRRVGVIDKAMKRRVEDIITSEINPHRPIVEVQREWYY